MMDNAKVATKVEYTEGYVAFIDILGFSDLVKQESCDLIHEIIASISMLKKNFIDSGTLGCKMAYFSDSIVLTSENQLSDFLIPLCLLEKSLHNKSGLLYRGAITKGKYYHDDNIAFGPAIVDSVETEKAAEDSRIITRDCFEGDEDAQLFWFRDYDGKWCWNPYSVELHALLSDMEEAMKAKKISRKKVINQLVENLKNIRDEIIEGYLYYQYYDIGEKGVTTTGQSQQDISCEKNNFHKKPECDARVLRKYLWRVNPFNYTCDYIIKRSNEITCLEQFDESLTASEIKAIKGLKITTDDYVMGTGLL